MPFINIPPERIRKLVSIVTTVTLVVALFIVMLGLISFRRSAHIRDITPSITVSQDGSGDFTTVIETITAAPSYSKKYCGIRIKAGVYNEIIRIPHEKTRLALMGKGTVVTFISFNPSEHDGWAEDNTATVRVDICKHTDYPDTCFKILSSDPRNKGRNFHELAELSIIINKEKGVQFLADISELQLTTTELYAKRRLDSCYGYYDSGVVGRSSDSLDEFHAGNNHHASFLLNDCITSVNECDNVYLHPPLRPNVLRQRNAEMIQHSEVAQSLVDYISSK